jgi:hypothetical protein
MCRAEFSRQYFAYREANKDAFRLSTQRAEWSMAKGERARVLYSSNMSVEAGLLNCAAEAGDQAALYGRAVASLLDPRSGADVAKAFADLSRAAADKELPSSMCGSQISSESGYECNTGLPEAHLLLAMFFYSCGPQFNEAFGGYHADLARRSNTSAKRVLTQQLASERALPPVVGRCAPFAVNAGVFYGVAVEPN